MSYDLGLYYDGVPTRVDRFEEGGTYVLGGATEAQLNITWNYAFFYYHFLDKEGGIRWLYGKTGAETVGRLEKAVEILGTRQYKDYWADTPGNAGYALSVLLTGLNNIQKRCGVVTEVQ